MNSFILFSSGILTLIPFLIAVSGASFELSLVSAILILTSFPHFVQSYLVLFEKKQFARIGWFLLNLIVLFAAFCFLGSKYIYLFELGLRFSFAFLLWHFAKQVYGVSLFFNREVRSPKTYRSALLLVCLAGAFFGFVQGQNTLSQISLFKYHLTPFAAPPLFLSLSQVATVAAFIGFVIYSYLQKFSDWKKWLLSLLPVFFFLTWMQCLISIPLLIAFTPVFHGLQYLPFTAQEVPKSFRWTVGLYMASAIAGFMIFQLAPRALTESGFSEIVLTSFIVSLNLNHFLIDSTLWKSSQSRLVSQGN